MMMSMMKARKFSINLDCAGKQRVREVCRENKQKNERKKEEKETKLIDKVVPLGGQLLWREG